MDPYKVLGIAANSDGSITRVRNSPTSPPNPDATSDSHPPVLSKDIPLNPNPNHNTWLRLYLPNHHHDHRLPVIVHFHGGGFVLFSAATSYFHDSCNRIASELPALVVSLEYRLAPEHPLPAAYDDAMEALTWIRDTQDPWLLQHGDLSRCFLAGSSSGGNIAFHAGLRSLSVDLLPIRVVGLAMNIPYFGGEKRTESELRLENDRIIPLVASDLLWKMSLPAGSDRDHEFCNPMKDPKRVGGEGKTLPRCLVRGYVGDPLVDRQKEFATWLEGRAESVVVKVDMEGFHGIELFDKAKDDEFINDIKNFVYGSAPVAAAKY